MYCVTIIQDIYDWISQFNKLLGSWFILTLQSMGKNKYGISGHLQYFHFFEALNDAFEGASFRASFMHLIKDITACF